MVPQISGRIVNSLDDITVQEVPTDGTVALFPSADGSCVYSKRWTPDGNILTMPELMAVIDQHMEAIKVVYPSEYDAIVAKVKSLHEAT